MAQRKTLSEASQIGDAGIALIYQVVNAMGHVWQPGNGSTDVGIDGAIELRDRGTGAMSGRHVYVQSKARKIEFPGETEHRFHYVCDPRDLDYWLSHPEPVLLVCSHPDTGHAWFKHLQGWFSTETRKAARRVEFDKVADAFVPDAREMLLSLADPHGHAHTPAAIDKLEQLMTNLLPVDMPPLYFKAPTRKSSRAVREAQQASERPERQDFVLANKHIYSFAALSGTALAQVPDVAANTHPTAELADGSPAERRLLVELLNRTLRQDLSGRCAWHYGRDLLYVRAPADLAATSKESVRSTTGRNRQVFATYLIDSDPAHVAYHRHAALRWQFIDVDGQWFAALRPDYYFSYDGYRQARNARKYLAGIKRRDRHSAVLGETRMWVAMLRETEGTFGEDSRVLHFGEPLTLTIDVGIEDHAWQSIRGLTADAVDDSDLAAADAGDIHSDVGNADDSLAEPGQNSLFDEDWEQL